jgi:hypothetical protein
MLLFVALVFKAAAPLVRTAHFGLDKRGRTTHIAGEPHLVSTNQEGNNRLNL